MGDEILKIPAGCADYLVAEVEKLRREAEILRTEKRVMDNFFFLVNRLGDLPKQGFEEDKLWQAKRDIENAKKAHEVEIRLRSKQDKQS